MVIKKYKVKKHSLTNFRKDWNKFPEILRGKFPEISELTTLIIGHIGDGFYGSSDPTNSVKALKEEKSIWTV